MQRILFLSSALSLLVACDGGPFGSARPTGLPTAPAQTEPVPSAVAPPAPLAAVGQTAVALDTASNAERAAALSAPPPAGERELGRVTVGLGNPAETGFWLRSALVTSPGKGRVVTADGQSIAVDLLPGASGAQLSLSAFRALGLSLTGLPEVTVYGS